jgi:hypothetical protein
MSRATPWRDPASTVTDSWKFEPELATTEAPTVRQPQRLAMPSAPRSRRFSPSTSA